MSNDTLLKDPREQRPLQQGTDSAMTGRISFYQELMQQPVSLMFIDSILPHHQRLNYALIGDTASENDSFSPKITGPHSFQVGMVRARSGNGPAFHTHDYIEAFMPLTDHKWRFYWGETETRVDGEAVIGKWDLISLPPKLWRGFEVLEGQEGEAHILGILEEHKVFSSKDPYWSPFVIQAAEREGFFADESGKMQKPNRYAQLEQEMLSKLEAFKHD
ncbi:MAG: cupin domain-containing protein [Deinococcales bacterium]